MDPLLRKGRHSFDRPLVPGPKRRLLISDINVRTVPNLATPIQKLQQSPRAVHQDMMFVKVATKLPNKSRQTKSVVLNRIGLKPGVVKEDISSPSPQSAVIIEKLPGVADFKNISVKNKTPLRFKKLSFAGPLLASIKKKKSLVRRSKLNIIYAMACITFLAGIGGVWQTMHTNEQVKAQVQGLSTNAESDGSSMQPFSLGEDEVPDETVIDAGAVSRYSVAPNLPRYIKIDKLGELARVRSLGILRSGALDAPRSIYDAGWYNGSSRPGDPSGAALIIGHVAGFIKPAVFANLSDLEKGDTIQIERGDGLIVKYAVVYKEVVDRDKVDMAKALVSADPRAAGLNIITCHGKYDKVAKTYSQRLVVYATQV